MQKRRILFGVGLLVVLGCGEPSGAPPEDQGLVGAADRASPDAGRAAEPEPGAGAFVGQAMGRGASNDEEATPMEPALRVALVRSMMAEAATDARYAFAREGRAVEAMHASQDLRARFRAEELTLTDEQGEQPIRISLSEVNGRPAGRASLHTEGNRVEVRRAGLTEWYVHGSLGLEQGFTLERAPAGAADEVLLTVAVDAPGYTVSESAEGIDLTHESRLVSVRDFFAEDATGRLLEAEMSWRGEALELRVNLEGAQYPVVIDPVWSQQARLVASDAAANDNFGRAVSVSGNTAVVGSSLDDAPLTNSGSAYVFVRSGTSWTQQAKLVASDAAAGYQFGQSVSVSGETVVVGTLGSAYVFVRSGTSWTQQAKLVASDAAEGDAFGQSVSVSGDTAVVGAYLDDAPLEDSGSAYVFVRSGTSWTQQAKLVASDAAAFDWAGTTVSVSGDTAVVGAYLDDAPLTNSGSAYVFVRSGTSWTQQAKLVASDAAADEHFGRSVSVSGGTVVVGAEWDDAPLADSGSAYVFVRSGTSWTQQAKLVASDAAAGDVFGYSVSVSGNTAVVGAYVDDAPLTNSGSAYVFVRSGTSWTQQAKLVASDAAADDRFGVGVSVSGETVVVGAYLDNAFLTDSGSAYVFTRTCGNGVLDAGEACDDGNNTNGDCCSSVCTYEPATVVCRASAGACDVAETCTGSSAACPVNGFAPSTTTCTGTSNGGLCDGIDRCSGTANTCVDRFAVAGTSCRASAGACDVAETCSGSSAACPVNGFAPSTTTCTGTSNGGLCDGTDRCSGTANTCVDRFAVAGTSCRASAGACDVAETCSGSTGACPVNGFAPSTTTCTGSSNLGLCDVTDRCSGTANTCVDRFAAAGTSCRASAGVCDVAETCAGTSGACPVNGFAPSTTACTGTSNGGLCDGTDRCSGTANTCVDGAVPAGTICRASVGVCDVGEACTGSPGPCPVDGFAPVQTTCTGTSNGCY